MIKLGLPFISFASKEFHMMFADKGFLTLGKVMPLEPLISFYVTYII